MGVKSTVYLTREEAIARLVELKIKVNQRKIQAKYMVLSNTELEDKLEILNDRAHDGEGYQNYIIDDNKDEQHGG